MSSRDKILKEIAQNKPKELAAPPTFAVATAYEDVTEKFLSVAAGIGASVRLVNDYEEAETLLQQQLQKGLEVVSDIEALSLYNSEAYKHKTAMELAGVDTVFLRGQLAVAENGAVWLAESRMVNRMLPFICQHLVLLVEEKNIVGTMHQAYDVITINEEGYGAFIAGPSKTADIEQSLVIGAHGPLQLQVFIIKK